MGIRAFLDFIDLHLNKIHKNTKTDCWEWIGAKNKNGTGGGYYAVVSSFGKNRYAHLVCYEAINGLKPKGLVLDHLCRNTMCINPKHLEAVTHIKNVRRGDLMKTRKERCPRGHLMVGENISQYYNSKKDRMQRRCRECTLIREKKYRLKKNKRQREQYEQKKIHR